MLQAEFEFVANPSYRCELTADGRGLVYRNVEDRKGGPFEKCVNVVDIIGCHCMREKNSLQHDSIQKNAYFCVYVYPLRKKSFSIKTFRRSRETLTFKIDKHDNFEENLELARKWKLFIVAAIRCNEKLMSDVTDNGTAPKGSAVKPRKLLILVNPNSGPKKARQIFNERVKPVLTEAGIQFDLVITERANHAKEIVQTTNLTEWQGIVIVSGDGLIYEVVNGIMARADWRDILKIPLGIIPGGSGNGLARAISYSMREPYDSSNQMYNSMAASLNLIRGRITHMDLIKVMTRKETIYSFLSIGWGLFADIDIESEKMRSLGEARFMLRAFVRIAGLRLYKGRLSYLPIEGYIPPQSPRQKSNGKIRRSKTVSQCSESSPSNKSRIMKAHSISTNDLSGNSNCDLIKAESEQSQTNTSLENAENRDETDLSLTVDGTCGKNGDDEVKKDIKVLGDSNCDNDESLETCNTDVSGLDTTLSDEFPELFDKEKHAWTESDTNSEKVLEDTGTTDNDKEEQINEDENPEEYNISNCGTLKVRKSSSEDDVSNGNEGNGCNSSLDAENTSNGSTNEEHFVEAKLDDKNVINGNQHPSESESSASANFAFVDDKETSVHIPPLHEPVPDNWIVEENEYVMIYISSVTHVGSDICLAPDARFDDGIMWMVIIRGNVTRAQILEFCLCLEDGRHVNSNSCSVIPIRAFRLEPDVNPNRSHPGYLTVDGEVIEYGPIQAGVLPSVARVMTR